MKLGQSILKLVRVPAFDARDPLNGRKQRPGNWDRRASVRRRGPALLTRRNAGNSGMLTRDVGPPVPWILFNRRRRCMLENRRRRILEDWRSQGVESSGGALRFRRNGGKLRAPLVHMGNARVHACWVLRQNPRLIPQAASGRLTNDRKLQAHTTSQSNMKVPLGLRNVPAMAAAARHVGGVGNRL